MGEMALPCPPELLNDTFSYFAKNELKVLRLVCRQFEKAASQFLFDRVVISNNFASLDTAERIIGSFSSMIKTITFCPVFYQDLTQEHLLAARQHLQKTYATYCRLALEQQEILDNGECLEILNDALKASTNARTLVVGAPLDTGLWDWDMLRYGVSRRNLCPSNSCTIWTEGHLDLYIRPESCYRRPVNETWYPAMLALSAADSQISEIDMNSSDGVGWESCLSIAAFDSTPPQVRHVRNRLEVLVKLRLELGVLPTDSADQACYHRGDVAKALSTAHNLKSLWLHACQPNWNSNGEDQSINSFQGSVFASMHLFLGGCQFPRLQSLILQSFQASESDLLALLHGSLHLGSLLLSGFSLIKGSWRGWVEQARRMPSLKRITLHYLHGLGYHDPNGDYLVWHTPMVDEFFFGSGENPFTREAMIQHMKAQWDCSRGFTEGVHRGYLLKWYNRFYELEDYYYGPQHTHEQR